VEDAFAAAVDPAAPGSVDEVRDRIELEFTDAAGGEPVDGGASGAAGVDEPEPVAAVEFRHGAQEAVDVGSFGALFITDDFVICHAVFIHLSFLRM